MVVVASSAVDKVIADIVDVANIDVDVGSNCKR